VWTLVADVFQCCCDINLFSTFSHAVQDHVDKTVCASATNSITETNTSVSVLDLFLGPWNLISTYFLGSHRSMFSSS
jgi:hypothetical protein